MHKKEQHMAVKVASSRQAAVQQKRRKAAEAALCM